MQRQHLKLKEEEIWVHNFIKTISHNLPFYSVSSREVQEKQDHLYLEHLRI